MAFEIIKEIYEREHPRLGAVELAVLQAVAYHASFTTRRGFPGTDLLMSETGLSESSVKRGLRNLEEAEYVRRWAVGNRRYVRVKPAAEWPEATLRADAEGATQTPEGATVDPRGFTQTPKGARETPKGAPETPEPVSNQSMNQSPNPSEEPCAPSGRAGVRHVSLGERELSTNDLVILLQQQIVSACEEREVKPKSLDTLDPGFLRSRFAQIQRKYSVTPADIVWMLDWFIRKTATRWDNFPGHPGQWFVTDSEVKTLVEALRNNQAEADVEDSNEGVNC